MKAATTKSKLSPLLRPAEAYLCKMANMLSAMPFTFSSIDGNSYFITQLKHWSVRVLS